MAEAAIRRRIEDAVSAIRAKDIDGIMSVYAPNVVSFDIVPPLRYVGTADKRRAWQEAFAGYAGPIGYEVRELAVAVQGQLAFAHSINHVSGKLPSGQHADLWLRWTACFQQFDRVWLVVHDHASVPADLAHGQALLDLKP